MKQGIFTLFILFFALVGMAQQPAETKRTKKELQAKRIEIAPKIDGFIDENIWKTAEIATDFVESSPDPMTPSDYKTEVKLLYDDAAVYVSFMCYDESGDVVLKQLSQRDNLGNTDWIAVTFNEYQDGLNGEGFVVTAAGVQVDVKYSDFSEDGAWNAVWESEVQILENGWSVEMKIPFAALRFPDADIQTWNINFKRSVRRTREESWWNPVDPKIAGFLNQAGELVGIKDVASPTRLFFYPYISTNAVHEPNGQGDVSNWSSGFNAGMDVKYGINDAFTLDMTLIPDFGQVRSDNQVLNLSPFEVVFDENRQFFTEGTELFNKGNIFYSRRIGARPSGFYDVENQLKDTLESIVSNPSVTQLINSTKVSGRTNSGLGVGVFNSVTNKMNATIRDAEGETRAFQTEPLTNYNILVLDQNFKNNSFLTLINTNVQRFGTTDDANVGGAVFRFNNKTNDYSASGKIMHSYKMNDAGETNQGFQSLVELGKVGGNFNFSYTSEILSDKYNHNDLGVLFRNNSINNSASIGYNIFKPFGSFNRARFRVNSFLSHRYSNQAFQDFAIEWDVFFLMKTFFAFGVNGRFEPVTTYDYFEPRVEERYLEYPTNRVVSAWFSSDYRKKVAIDGNISYRKFDQEGRENLYLSIEPRFRVNDKLFFVYEISQFTSRNDIGYTTILDAAQDSIIMGRRLNITTTHQLDASYIFNNKMGLTFRMRHYWSTAKYNNYYLLGKEGTLDESDYTGLEPSGESKHDVSLNVFNIDCIYNWQFAPGSFLTVVWKNSINRRINNTEERFVENLRSTIDADQNNNFNIKALFFVDYLKLKRLGGKKNATVSTLF
ncbi:MAG: DUF5916 domain-containing protein [Saprospiraceae bacterium]